MKILEADTIQLNFSVISKKNRPHPFEAGYFSYSFHPRLKLCC